MIARSEVTTVLRLANATHGPSSAHPIGPLGEPGDHDHLASGELLREFLGLHRVSTPTGLPDAAQLDLLRSIRDATRALTREPDPTWRARVEPLASRFLYRLDAAGSPQPVDGGWDGFAATAVAELLRLASDRERVRLCDADACRWLFLDDSKNLQRRWCEMATCGSRDKMRRYRARRRQGATRVG